MQQATHNQLVYTSRKCKTHHSQKKIHKKQEAKTQDRHPRKRSQSICTKLITHKDM